MRGDVTTLVCSHLLVLLAVMIKWDAIPGVVDDEFKWDAIPGVVDDEFKWECNCTLKWL
jgi:hypothetical protein